MKRLSFRFVRRLMLLLALVFPVVYLMGGFVAALAGSHGNVTLAQDDEVVTSSKIVDFNQLMIKSSLRDSYSTSGISIINNGDGSITLSGTATEQTWVYAFAKGLSTNLYISLVKDHTYFVANSGNTPLTTELWVNLDSSTASYESITVGGKLISGYSALTQLFKSIAQDTIIDTTFFPQVFDLTQMYGAGNEPTAEEFRSRYTADYYDYTLSTKLVEETFATPTYSEFLFNQILGSDNIIKQWGYYALCDEDKGFAPFASLIQIVDDNFFHLGDSNDLGLFVYGYVYYALNIVAIYELVALVVMVFTIPLKLTDRFTKEM